VSIPTSFVRRRYTPEELIEGWRARGATLGFRGPYVMHINASRNTQKS
jgi:hypothetical protein